MDPSLSSPPANASASASASTNAMPPRPPKRPASSEPPLPSSSPPSSAAAGTKRQRSLHHFFSRSSSPTVSPANGLEREPEPVMPPTPANVHAVSSPLAAPPSTPATANPARPSQLRPAPTSPTMSRSTIQQRPQAAACASTALAPAPGPAAAATPATARPTTAAISLQIRDSSNDENKVAPATPEQRRRIRGRPNVRSVQIEILVPPLPLAVGLERPAVAPVSVVALSESDQKKDASTNGRVLRPRNASVAQPLPSEHPTPTATTAASSASASSSSSRYDLRTRPAPAPSTTYVDLSFSPSPPRALQQPTRATGKRISARRGRRPTAIQLQRQSRSLVRTLSSSSCLSDLSSLSDDERDNNDDDDGDDDFDIVSIAPRPARTPARRAAAPAPSTSASPGVAADSSPPLSPGASPGLGSERSARTLSTATEKSSRGQPFAFTLGKGMSMSGLVVSESEDEDDEKKAVSSASLSHFTCPFCGHSVSTGWDDVIDDVYQRILSHMPPLVKKAQQIKRQTRASKLEFIHAHQFDPSLSKNMDDHVRATKPICDKHKRRAVMLEAHAKGWPTPESIDWEAFRVRIHSAPFLDLLDGVVENYHGSPYGGVYARMVHMYNECGGGARFRNQAMLSKKLEMNRVGYYGQRGAFELFNALADAFLHDPKSALGQAELGVFRDSEFVSDILVPTAGVILIQQDMQAELGREVSFDEAWQMMKETADYGDVVAPLQKT